MIFLMKIKIKNSMLVLKKKNKQTILILIAWIKFAYCYFKVTMIGHI